MRYPLPRRLLPPLLRDWLLFFEARIEREVAAFARAVPAGARILDAGAGEARHRAAFPHARYLACDLGVGDAAWNYSRLDVLADLSALPFAPASFDAALNIVTLEHLPDPALALAQIAGVLKPGAPLLLAAPLDWEVHQAPHDYFRYTRHGLDLLLRRAGLDVVSIQPVGGFFRLLSRRLLNSLLFFPGLFKIVPLLFFVPPALLLPLLDGLDRSRDFTLGYTCIARKPLS